MTEAVLREHGSAASRRRISAAELAVALVFAYAATGAIAYRALDDRSFLLRLLQPQFFLALPAGAALSLPLVLMSLRRRVPDRGGHRVAAALAAWKVAWAQLERQRIVYVALVCLLAALFLNIFIAWKALIPRFHPFAYDAELARWSLALDGGVLHRLLPWLPIPLLDPLYYYGWTIALLSGTLVLAWVRDTRALLVLLLTWIVLGTFVATLVSSAGPPYFTAVTGLVNPYQDVFARLATAEGGRPAFALEVQRSLWAVYRSGAIVSGTGISAFPSMHVATGVVFTLAARPRWLRTGMGIYTLLIFIGSVALGWHYELDGYAAIAGAALIWWLTGRLARPGYLPE